MYYCYSKGRWVCQGSGLRGVLEPIECVPFTPTGKQKPLYILWTVSFDTLISVCLLCQAELYWRLDSGLIGTCPSCPELYDPVTIWFMGLCLPSFKFYGHYWPGVFSQIQSHSGASSLLVTPSLLTGLFLPACISSMHAVMHNRVRAREMKW